ncbi:hypothetical protein NLK61_18620 [Pseudomonas fuscovaginae UPB0736]|uniref:Uncharacterized protein n=1 Tax=Pseudomonas asplenii TaxID=53407 RepID=A0A1H6MTD4_9PSED|nr:MULTISPECIES: hypothetical protein [Pseudomonas]UUQ63281.1 hypothetical protein NLK61_18620 [Pseudomonas fuscovaginae UPB0736]UZE28210.1 hypothetical protein LOY63_23205 [Pseudomonas asplenii]SEI05283.1 hypothetical protein SAMN05216581_1591 [Pseudomonas fuscovaginae]
MSEAIRDDLIRLLHNQLPDHPADYFQLSTELNQHQLWLEYNRPTLLLMLAHPGAQSAGGSTDFIARGPGEPVMLLFDTWFRDQAARALFVEPCSGERASILATCAVFLQRCASAHQVQE